MLMSQNPRSKFMQSKSAASSLDLLLVLLFAPFPLSASSSQAAQGPLHPQVGLQAALPLVHPGLSGPGGQMRPPFSPQGRIRMKQKVGRPEIGWADQDLIFLTTPSFGSGGYFEES